MIKITNSSKVGVLFIGVIMVVLFGAFVNTPKTQATYFESLTMGY